MAFDFLNPAREFGPAPFWWWVGDPLEHDRMTWQLDRLKEKGVLNTILSYNHHADGSSDRGEPPVFSPAWWDLVRTILQDCKERGMQLSFEDYTLLNPELEAIGKASPDMQCGSLKEVHVRGQGGSTLRLVAPDSCKPLRAWAYPIHSGRVADGEGRCVSDAICNGRLDWEAPEGEWLVVMACVAPGWFDPFHPQSGQRAIERFFQPFERELGEHLGTTVPISFQDELDFGSRMPFWSKQIATEFAARKGYDLMPHLAALWHDLGPISPKIRIDYADVVVTLLEERFYKPVYEWHEAHGLLFGHDNIGRGGIESSNSVYGDPFRAMRWYSAPGTDDAILAQPRAFRGLKVNGSIAHLYQRPRVWCECFHSSGWGTTPADVVRALNEDFIYGATVVNLHGLYYSTHGSWWEWAPPDFHFRQPYWDHSTALTNYSARLCETLSQGVHVCDVAILYPITALEGGLNSQVLGERNYPLDIAEHTGFEVGRALVRNGIDFDYLDFESLERAEIVDGKIQVSGESYRVLILPWMSAVRFSSLERAKEFAAQGGQVIAYGCLPKASERVGAEDPLLDQLVAELFGPGGPGSFVPESIEEVVQQTAASGVRDFDPGETGWMVVHRRSDEADFYFLFNPSQSSVRGAAFFRATGPAEQWDPWTGTKCSLAIEPAPGGSRVELELAPGAGTLVVFPAKHSASQPAILPGQPFTARTLPDSWDFELVPTMDNRFGDFRLPATDSKLGPEMRRFRYFDATDALPDNWTAPDFDDNAWESVTYSFGPRFWVAGPLPPETEIPPAGTVDPSRPLELGGQSYPWRPYAFSLRWGVENDPHLMDYLSGPHGLKGEVPDDFIDLHCDAPGARWLLWTGVEMDQAATLPFTMGSRAKYRAWLNGEEVLRQTEELPPGRQSLWNLPHYHSTPQEKPVTLQAGINPLVVEFTQPAGQRTRGYAAFQLPQTPGLALRWFTNPAHPRYSIHPGTGTHTGLYRFHSPAGLARFVVRARGPLEAWVNGEPIAAEHSETLDSGLFEYRFTIANPSRDRSHVALRVALPAGSYGGDGIPEPIELSCTTGTVTLGDWCGMGLEAYSGSAWYRQTVTLTAAEAQAATHLDLGSVFATAEVYINSQPAATLIAPPWQADVRGLFQAGENRIQIHLANTLANHFSIGIPSPYVLEGQTRSGLFGPVRIAFGHAESEITRRV